MFHFPLWVGKTWTTTTNVTGKLVPETGAGIPIDTIAAVSGEVTDEVDVTEPDGTITIPCLVIENNISFELKGQLVLCLVRYRAQEPPIVFPKKNIIPP
jgi:hypothetical protein